MIKKWEVNEIEFLKENYNRMNNKKIGEKLGRSESSIKNKAHKLNLKEINTHQKRFCIYCGKEFLSANKKHKYCSDICYYRKNKKKINKMKKFTPSYKKTYPNKRYERLCKLCSTKFITGKFHPYQVFCSKKCVQKYHDNIDSERNRKKRNYTIKNKKVINERRIKNTNEWIKNGRELDLKNHYIKILPKDIEQVLLGSLLGDGCLTKNYKKKLIFSETHCLKQKEYLLWKKQFFDEEFNTSFYYGKSVDNYGLNVSSLDFYPYYKIFYPNGKKQISSVILNKLTPLAIAVWYMDDGSFDKGEIRLASYFCGEKGNLLIKDWFMKTYKIELKLTSKGDVLRARVKESKKFIELIKPYVQQIECMSYKLGNDYYNKRRK